MVHTVVGSNFLYERLEVYYEYFSKWGSVFCVYLIIDTMPYLKWKMEKCFFWQNSAFPFILIYTNEWLFWV